MELELNVSATITVEDAAAALGVSLPQYSEGWRFSGYTNPPTGMTYTMSGARRIGITGTPTEVRVTTLDLEAYDSYGNTKVSHDFPLTVVDPNAPEPEPEPEPVPAESTLVPDVIEFLGLPDTEDMRRLAKQHVRIVTTFVRNYTRGNGFDGEGKPNQDIHDVIITATARYLPNPTQATRQSMGNQSIGYASIEGFTLAEKAVLNRYRKMTSRGNIVTTTSTGTTGTTTTYATVQYVDTKFAGIPRTDLDGYATTAYVDDVARSLEVDLNPYATRSYVDVAIDRIPDVDLTDYVTNGELSAALEAIPEPDPVDLTPYALKSEIPAAPDLAPYVTDAELSTALATVMPRSTAPRQLKALLPALSEANDFQVFRIGNLVIAAFANLKFTTGATGDIWKPTQGYSLPTSMQYSRPGMVLTTEGDVRLVSGTAARGLYLASFAPGASYHGTLTWVTRDDWPTTLPGVSA